MASLSLYLLTFNCARTPVDIDLFASHFFNALPHTDSSPTSAESSSPPELIVLCLEEIAPIAYAFLGGSYLDAYFNTFRQVVYQAVSKRWDVNYDILVRDNSGMTGLLVLGRSDIVDKVTWIDSARVGFGVQQMGNKGAVGARLGYSADGQAGNTVDLTFIAAHLAPMEYAWEQRNKDWRSIVERLVFSREQDAKQRNVESRGDAEESAALLQDQSDRDTNDGGVFIPTTYLFLGGDLNYRTSNRGPLKGEHVRFPQFNADPSSPQHYSHLLKEDQLLREMRNSRCFQGFSEAPITFPPTYKYTSAARQEAREAAQKQTGQLQEWKWTSSRWPSWCDRILYLDTPRWMQGARNVQPHKYDALPLFPTSDHRPVALSVSVPLEKIQVPKDIDPTTDVRLAAPFAVDPEWKSKRDSARTKEILVGCLAYVSWTWEGNGFLFAVMLGLVGAWIVLGSIWSA